ncbi:MULTISPECIES: glycosyltransferase family 2 protein [Ensifer]|uniref:glycosyltransferase family 2 protein n=1 Tax=Ensifer TaxID=106591 RepID=UPI00070EDE59|nr:glycosyltransferase family 2 protein [Ensifer sp. Root127]KQW54826.1 glycosyl transferase [Ensifer sp. Root127]NOV17025.1 glycosyltransferase family 2 protein [Ensifer canadensis]
MSDVKLSICIPTYNRADFLTKALTYFVETYEIPYNYEIVISDNASPDNTGEVVENFIAKGLPIRYFRCQENLGYEPNLASAFRHARGEYNIYASDDDMLVMDGLIEAISYMDKNPDLVVCYAPWYLHNEQLNVDHGSFYTVDNDVKFKHRNFMSVFNFLIDQHVFPEVGIYRSAALRAAWVPRYFAYWAFSHLAHYLDIGAVAFLKKPFYRAVIVSKIVRDRPQAGNEEVMTAWDRYRGGLEYFLYVGAKRGAIEQTADMRAVYDEAIKQFTLTRMGVAMRFWAAKKDYVRAYELYTRLLLGGHRNNPDVTQISGSIHLMAAVQTLAWLVNASAEVNRLVLYGVADHASLESLLREAGLRNDVAVISYEPDQAPDVIERSAVFVNDAADRDAFVTRGFPPNLILSDADITRAILP